MTAVDRTFADLRREGRKALMPFITAGDPDLEFTAALLAELAARGGNLCEVGVPYSDPIADGPVIQSSFTRALAGKVHVADIFATLTRATSGLPSPVLTMLSYAIVYRHGPARFVAQAQEAGIAGAIIPDLPVDEAGELAALARQREFNLVQLVTPTTPRERALRIAESSSGFIYYVSVTGITGERQDLPAELLDNVAWLRERTPLPICIGFGISRPEHVRQLAPVADGLIVGSAIVRRVAEVRPETRAQVICEIGDYVASLRAALDEVTAR